MSKQIYYFGQFSLDPAERLLLRSGAPVGLSPKIFDLLLHLSGNAGRLVSKKELMDAVWAGTFVEEATLARAVSDLRKALGDGEAGQRFIETVPKFGYRFICDVAVRGADAEQGDDTAGPRRSRLRWAVGAVGAVVGLSGLIWIGVWNRPSGPATIESVAILPIRAESIPLGAADPGVSIADTLITSLSRATTLEVRSLNAVRRYAGKEVDPLEAGRELRVDAVLEGSLLSSGQKMRLNARLLRVKDGRTLWSGTIEEETGDPLSLQDQFASEVANSISSHLTEEQRAALADHGTTDRLAQQSLLRGRQYSAQRSGDGFRRAIECFEDAIRRDPN
ncbi:MAG: winged helix-turn-helix domain-containing protein [Bryobacteraceae bacterium]|nr:winged helix-turn-helix domain-containing protein [Bryobacteraceae bacterium]